jgi:hypothetical protein
MGEEKSDRLGLRGRLAHIDSTLRLLGGANATGAIAAGAAFHAFEKNADVQNAVKAAAVLFLVGVLAFAIAYTFLFFGTHDIDHSLHKDGEPTWPEYLFWESPTKSAEQYRKQAKFELVVMVFSGLASFVLFFIGLGWIIVMALRLLLG